MAQANWKRPLILAALLLVFGSFATWLEYSHKPQKEKQEEASKKMFHLEKYKEKYKEDSKVAKNPTPPTQIKGIEINGAQHFEFSCSDLAANLCKPGDQSKWEISSPMKAMGDDSNINSLLSTLNQLSATEVIDLSEEKPEKRATILKEYGLDAQALNSPATKRVWVKSTAGDSMVYFGNVHPIGESIFALRKDGDKVDDTHVYMIGTYFKSNFEHDLTYWRNKKLLTIGSHDISEFKLETEKNHLVGVRKDGVWSISSGPEVLAGDTENIEGVLNAATYLTAKNFISDQKSGTKALETLKATKSIMTLTLQKESSSPTASPAAAPTNQAPIVLTFYKKKPENKNKSKGAKDVKGDAKGDTKNDAGPLYATVSNLDPLFELDPTAEAKFDKSIKDLRLSKLITSMERYTAKRLEFAGPSLGQPLILTQTDGKWASNDGANKDDLDLQKIQNFLDKLSSARIKDFLQDSAIPTGPTSEDSGLKFTLGDEKSDTKHQFVFWKKSDQLYARDTQLKRKEAFLMDGTLLNEIPSGRGFFKKADVKASPAPVNK